MNRTSLSTSFLLLSISLIILAGCVSYSPRIYMLPNHEGITYIKPNFELKYKSKGVNLKGKSLRLDDTSFVIVNNISPAVFRMVKYNLNLDSIWSIPIVLSESQRWSELQINNSTIYLLYSDIENTKLTYKVRKIDAVKGDILEDVNIYTFSNHKDENATAWISTSVDKSKTLIVLPQTNTKAAVKNETDWIHYIVFDKSLKLLSSNSVKINTIIHNLIPVNNGRVSYATPEYTGWPMIDPLNSIRDKNGSPFLVDNAGNVYIPDFTKHGSETAYELARYSISGESLKLTQRIEVPLKDFHDATPFGSTLTYKNDGSIHVVISYEEDETVVGYVNFTMNFESKVITEIQPISFNEPFISHWIKQEYSTKKFLFRESIELNDNQVLNIWEVRKFRSTPKTGVFEISGDFLFCINDKYGKLLWCNKFKKYTESAGGDFYTMSYNVSVQKDKVYFWGVDYNSSRFNLSINKKTYEIKDFKFPCSMDTRSYGVFFNREVTLTFDNKAICVLEDLTDLYLLQCDFSILDTP